MEMYYIALVAPPEINEQVLEWKNYMKDNHGCKVALRSPAHLTLVPPFWMEENLEETLRNAVDLFSAGRPDFLVQLDGFSSFPPQVLFVNVVPNHHLNQLYFELNEFLITRVEFPISKDDREFQPHVTFAVRDLHKKAYREAWEHFRNKKYKAEWKVNGISILRHNKKNWDVVYTSQFIRR